MVNLTLTLTPPNPNPPPVSQARLWAHECQRVFADRLINDADRSWFLSETKAQMKEHLKLPYDKVIYIYIYMYTHTHTYMYIYTYTHIYMYI